MKMECISTVNLLGVEERTAIEMPVRSPSEEAKSLSLVEAGVMGVVSCGCVTVPVEEDDDGNER